MDPRIAAAAFCLGIIATLACLAILWVVIIRRDRAPAIQTDLWKSEDEAFVIVWDVERVTPEQYAEFITALGDFVRARGGKGIKRVRSRGVVNEDRS